MSTMNARCGYAPWIAGSLLFSSFAFANLPPVIDSIADQLVLVGSAVEIVVIPRDPERVVPGLTISDMPNGATFFDNQNGTRTFKWVPSTSDVGSRLITFEAIDALDSNLRATVSITVTVNASSQPNQPGIINQAPRVEPLSDRTVQVGESVSFRVVPVDPEGVVPALSADSLPAGASFDDNRDGTRQFRWQPNDQQVGDSTISFTAFDESVPSLRSEETVKITVTPPLAVAPDNPDTPITPDDPVMEGAPFFVGLDDQFITLGDTLSLRVVAKDDDGSVPGLSIDRLPERASFKDNGDGTRTFRWQPYPIDLGDTDVRFSTIDANNSANRTFQTIRLNVVRDSNRVVNFPPVINGIRNPTIRVGDTLAQRVQPVDPDFTVPSLSALSIPPGSQLVDNGDGTRNLQWLTDAGDLGDTQASFRAVDSVDPSLSFESTITVSVVDPSTFARDGERLRDLADRRGFKIGYAAVLQASQLADSQLYRDIAAEEFNIVTPENSHKMGWIQPQRGVFKWEDADELANYAEQNGMSLHGHPLVWFSQLPAWVQLLDPSNAQAVMREHIRALVSRYRGRIAIWDVVNESFEDDGSYRNSIWHKGMGREYIRDAFVTARQEDPNAVLIYNDYDVAWKNPKSDAMYSMVEQEIAAGTPIDGVGFQMHLRDDFTEYDSVERNFERFANLGMDIYITEFDVAMFNGKNDELQADIFRRVMEICLRQPRCKALQSWGYTDRYSWRSNHEPLMLTDKYLPKPAYYEWQRVLRDF
ncbi:MAG: endo-1,4-beta-xylanase [Granulosicoccaceae bacterium]